MVTVMESKVEGGNNRPNCMVTPVLEETFQSFDLLIFFSFVTMYSVARDHHLLVELAVCCLFVIDGILGSLFPKISLLLVPDGLWTMKPC